MQVNAVTFLANGLLATAAGKVVSLWDVNACSMKQTLNHEGAVRCHMPAASTAIPPRGLRLPIEVEGWLLTRAAPLRLSEFITIAGQRYPAQLGWHATCHVWE